jgi:hypothetical protein
MYAPIALFAYRRPHHLVMTLEALLQNPEARDTKLYVFADAERDSSASLDVGKVRDVIEDISGFASVETVYRQQNFGLAKNITEGVSQVLCENETVIVVEDDIVVTPSFLQFMNAALNLYKDEPRVGSISGYCYPVRAFLPETFFIKGADCWGWATWRNRWAIYQQDGAQLLAELKSRQLEYEFDFGGINPFTQMLVNQIEGKINSWAVRWHASCFLRDMLILYPGRSLVQNIGQDGSGTHATILTKKYHVRTTTTPIRLGGIPIEQSDVGLRAYQDFFRRVNRPPSRMSGAVAKLKRIASRIANGCLR